MSPSSYLFNRAAVPIGVAAILILLTGLRVAMRERRVLAGRAFTALTLSLSVWLGASAAMLCAVDESVALWWAKVAHLGMPLIPVAALHVVLAILRVSSPVRRGLWAAWAVAAVMGIAGLTGQDLVYSMSAFGWGFYPRYGWLGVAMVVFAAGLWLAGVVTLVGLLRPTPQESIQHGRITTLLSAFVAVAFGAVDFIAAFGVAIYPWGCIPVLLFFALMAATLWSSRSVSITPALASRQILETMTDALLVFDRDGLLQLINTAAQTMFGYTSRELIGQSVAALNDLIFAGHFQRIVQVEAARNRTIPYTPKDGGLRTLSCSVSVMRDRASRPLGMVCVARDITDTKQFEKHAQLLQAILLVATRAEDVDGALLVALRKVCDATGWVLGEAWVPSADGSALTCSPVWYSRTVGADAFRAASERVQIGPGEGLAGRAWSTKQAAWMADVAEDPRFAGTALAESLSVRSGIAIPVLDADEVMAVLVFYSFESSRHDAPLMDAISAIAVHLGVVIHRKLAEHALKSAHADLERRIHERTAELSTLNARLQDEIIGHQLARRRLALQYATARVLAESPTAPEAMRALLKKIGESLGWSTGLFWGLDRDAQVLRCHETWQCAAVASGQLLAASRARSFESGEGLPGRVWQTGRPVWIPNVTRDENFPRANYAAADGLRGGFAFPVYLGTQVLGVMEFFRPDACQPDEDLLDIAAGLGSQIGQFLDRQRAQREFPRGREASVYA